MSATNRRGSGQVYKNSTVTTRNISCSKMSIRPKGYLDAVDAYTYVLQYVDGLITVEHSDYSGIAETTRKGKHKMAKAAKKAKAKKAKK